MRYFLQAAVFGLMLLGGSFAFRRRHSPGGFLRRSERDDAWSGKSAKPNADRTDGPLATLAVRGTPCGS